MKAFSSPVQTSLFPVQEDGSGIQEGQGVHRGAESSRLDGSFYCQAVGEGQRHRN